MFARVTGKHVLIALVGFFGITFCVNGFLIASALRSFSGEDASRSYALGLHYNDALAARAAQRAAGWRARLETYRVADGTAVLDLTLEDKNGKPVEGLALDGALRLPATARDDRILAFAEIGPGRYEARIANLEPAHWDLVVSGRAPRGPAVFEAKNRLWIR
jgi:nitrogen fixation protein FixH